MNELWKNIPDFDGYQASSLGRIRSLDGYILGGYRKKGLQCIKPRKGKILKNVDNGRYYVVTIRKKLRYVHRLVAITFIPNENNLPQINHKDGKKLNNILENLEWCTSLHNMQHAHKNDLIDYKSRFYTKNGRKSISESNSKKVLDTKNNQVYKSLTTAAKKKGMSISYLSQMLNGYSKNITTLKWMNTNGSRE